MGLENKTVLIKWERPTCTYYKNLGYVFTKIKDEFEVKVEDLPKSSNICVDVKCDHCGIVKSISFQNYNTYAKKDGLYYCNKCSKKLFGNEKMRKTLLLKKGESFEQWCIGNNRQDLLERWDYELNSCSTNDICKSTNKNYFFKCSNGIHESELKSINDFINGHKGVMDCKACNSFAQWGIDNLCDDFLEKYWDYEKNIIDPFKISYGSRNKKVWIKCQEKDYHGSYDTTCLNFVNGNRCPYCTNQHGKVHKLDSLGTLYPEVLEIWSDKNKNSPYYFTPFTIQRVWWKCPDGLHKDFKREILNSNTCNFRCPECTRERNESILQEKVRLYFEQLGYTILHEYNCILKCINPKTNCLLPYDNEIVELKLYCEVHGIQHYTITNFHNLSAKKFNTTPEVELQYIKDKDNYKKDFVLSNGYDYFVIPYWTDDKEKTWKKLINQKIQEIKFNTLAKEVI